MDEKKVIEEMLRLYPALKVGEIAVMLGVSRNTLYGRMKGYGIKTGIKKGRKKKGITISV